MATQRRADESAADHARETLHKLVDKLSADELVDARLYIDYVRSDHDPLIRRLMLAPHDDEPETEEERQAVAEARDDVKAGRTIPLEEIEREFGA